MRVVQSVLELIGETPLLRLGELEEGGAELWAKLENANPGGSVKDRIGVAMIRAAEAAGALGQGGTVVEATAGNTGIGLALAGRRMGYRVILVVPEKYAREKQLLAQLLGAEVVCSPTVEGMAGAQARAREIASGIAGAVHVDQFANPANPAAHAVTAAEIWQQVEGRLDALVVGCGSGGTLVGTARHLKALAPRLWVVAVEPQGSVLGGGAAGPHLVEGIGMDEIPPIWDASLADEIITVSDRDAFATVALLAQRCGVLAGSSGGANVAAARQVGQRLGPGRRVVTVIPDSCERYLSKDIVERALEQV